jgi:hypothetical protein
MVRLPHSSDRLNRSNPMNVKMNTRLIHVMLLVLAVLKSFSIGDNSGG